MITEMRFTADTICPFDGEKIPVAVEIAHDDFIEVETVLKMVAEITSKPVTQETFTKELKRALMCAPRFVPEALTVVTKGTHQGVEITCTESDDHVR
jgi:GTP cyclohydrolase I